MGTEGEREVMSSGSQSDRGGDRDIETDAPTVASAGEAMERQLEDALAAAETDETRFHLRQALQLLKAFDE